MAPLADRLEQFFRNEGPRGVVSAYLFGSHADGRAHRESDVDLAVLLDREVYRESRARFEVRVGLSSSLAPLAGAPADVVILNDAPPQFARHVVIYGRRLYCGNEESDHAFVRTTLSRAADLEPFLRRARATKLASLR
jgi:uncharacterized protein